MTNDTQKIVLKARNLVKRYGHVTAIDGADFDLREGEILAVIGDNGAGKSSLIKALSGALVPDSGEILLDDAQVNFKSGQYIDKVGYSDGDAGQQAIFSVYRIHFGHFGPEAMKIFFGLMGFALTIISVTGINLWLAKRAKQDALNQLWLGFVWGTPIAFIWAALLELTLALPTKPVFWVTLTAILIASLMQKVLMKTHLVLLNWSGDHP